MDRPGATFLYTLATLLVTFAGFSALLMMLRQAVGAQLSALDRFLTRTVVGHAMGLIGGRVAAAVAAALCAAGSDRMASCCLDLRPELSRAAAELLASACRRGRSRAAAPCQHHLHRIELGKHRRDDRVCARRASAERGRLHHRAYAQLLHARFLIRDRARGHSAPARGIALSAEIRR